MSRVRPLMALGPLLALCLAGCGSGEAAMRAKRPAMPAMPTMHWADAVVVDLLPSWPDDHRRPFLHALAPLAMRSGAEHCIPPSVTVAQGVLESGWGRSTHAVEHNNLFGMKAHRGEASATAATWEYVGGRRVRRNARFRTFSSWLEAVRQHDKRLAQHPAYEDARTVRTSAPAFVEALAPVYATDPAYETRLLGLIERYGLEALDPPTLERAEAREGCG